MAVTSYPDVHVYEIGKDSKFLMIACDGIWDCMSSQAAVGFYYKAKLKQMLYQPHSKGHKTGKKLEETINQSKFSGLATIVEMMMDINCAPKMEGNKGIGLDNMTGIIVEFKQSFDKDKTTSTEKSVSIESEEDKLSLTEAKSQILAERKWSTPAK